MQLSRFTHISLALGPVARLLGSVGLRARGPYRAVASLALLAVLVAVTVPSPSEIGPAAMGLVRFPAGADNQAS
eukprot:7623889-Alexandrium_andersonii.AAC.1